MCAGVQVELSVAAAVDESDAIDVCGGDWIAEAVDATEYCTVLVGVGNVDAANVAVKPGDPEDVSVTGNVCAGVGDAETVIDLQQKEQTQSEYRKVRVVTRC